MNDRSYRLAEDTVTLTNYTTRNPIIRLLLNNFMKRTGRLLGAIGADRLYGLDAGCGEGHFLAYLNTQKIVGRMVAVDFDDRKLSYARHHYPHCEYRSGDVQDLPFADNTFDFILSTEVFEHLPNPETALSEISRVAKPGAHLVISVPFEPFFHLGNLMRGLYWERGGRTPDHRSFWHRHEFRQFLSGYVNIYGQYSISTFPWLLFAGRFK